MSPPRVFRRMAGLLVLLTGTAALPACEADPRTARWRFTFESAALGAESVAVEAELRSDRCDGEVLHQTEVAPGGMATAPPRLDPGRYAFVGRSRDVACVYHATGCEIVELPLRDGAQVDVVLRAATDAAPACPPSLCRAGTCELPDAGPRDAGRDAGTDSGPNDGGDRDTGRVDAARDAGCAGGAPPRCEGDDLIQCVDGAPVATPCVLGCGIGPSGGTCRTMQPSNVRIPLETGGEDINIDANFWVFDTDDGSIEEVRSDGGLVRVVREPGEGLASGVWFGVLAPPAADAAVGVFGMATLTVRAPGSGLVGRGSRPLVLLVTGDVLVDGSEIRASVGMIADRAGPGGACGGVTSMAFVRAEPGGGPGGGGGGEDRGTAAESGGGGGGFGSPGGIGGTTAILTAGAPGTTYGSSALVPLVGGSGGGAGGDSSGGRGGCAGGAIQITSGTRIEIRSGAVSANGEGGQGGGRTATAGAGGGGGSGGAVLLEAPVVIVGGRIGANGGGGGQGVLGSGAPGSDGADGDTLLDGIPARGGGTDIPPAGGGGDGSNLDGAALHGGNFDNAGGGGGGAGRIRINTRTGTETFTNVSPSMSSGLTTVGAIRLVP